jgi:hypothetical protein
VRPFLSQSRKERKGFLGYINSIGFFHIQNFVFPFLLATLAPWRETFLSQSRKERKDNFWLKDLNNILQSHNS